MDQWCRTAGNGRLAAQPCHLQEGPGQHPWPATATIRGWQTGGRPKMTSMHSANGTKEVHLQNKSTDDEGCDELELQGEKLEARR